MKSPMQAKISISSSTKNYQNPTTFDQATAEDRWYGIVGFNVPIDTL